MNNQQGPFNSPFFPKAGERETEPFEKTRTTNQHGRLGHKTNLHGTHQQQTDSMPEYNTGANAQSSFAPPQQPWGTNGGPQSFLPQQFNNPFFPKGNMQQPGNADAPANNSSNLQTEPHTPIDGAPNATQNLGNSGMFRNPTGALGNTGTLMHPAGEYSGDTGMLKLNQAVKVVRIPVAGKPGEYKTGILPVLPQGNTGALPPPSTPTFQQQAKKNSKVMILAALIVLVIFASGIYLFTRPGSSNVANTPGSTVNGNNAQKTNVNATATANVQATATYNNLIFSDPLTTNDRNWLTTDTRSDLVKKGIIMNFKNGAYHISSTEVDGIAYFASSVLQSENRPPNFAYSVDMQQVKGKDDSDYNFFGLLFSYTEIGGNAISYAFRIIDNKSGPRYEFCTLDGRNKEDAWSEPMWKQNAGKEFKGTKAKNNLKVQVNGHDFTFWVNGQQVGKVHDTKYGPGKIGFGVNGLEGGSEVAFTNLLLTKN